jgi:peptide/nickel transport system substrate-binding protein
MAATIILSLRCSDDRSGAVVDSTAFEKLRSMRESPMLAELVKAGKLPPLEERLPEDPLVIEPYEEQGVHGGIWHFDVINRRDVNLGYYLSNPAPLRWDQDGISPIPHFCKSYKILEDGRVWEFYLRKGVKWSDGHPFTTEDIRFWYEDDALNKDLSPTPKVQLLIEKKMGRVEVIDDYTFRVVFPIANRAFFEQMTSVVLFYRPSHYLKQFHPKYADKQELQQRLKKAGVKKWTELYKRLDRWQEGYLTPERPTLRPWMISKKRGSPDTYEFVRNPYYWVTDIEGKQLPYIDKVIIKISSNSQVLAMNTIAGNFDFQWRRLDFKDHPLLKENEKKNNYELLTWPQDRCSDIAIYLNYNCTHSVVGSLLRMLKFRIALSLAINREELNLLFYKNVGVPRQATAAEATPFYVPEYARAYARYDTKQANKLLDELGLTQRDRDGFRLDKGGRPILLLVETLATGTTVDILQIVVEYWQAVGIKAEVKVVEGSLLRIRTQSSEIMMQASPLGSFSPIGNISKAFRLAPLFGLWHQTSGKEGEEPSDAFKKLFLLREQKKKSDLDDQIESTKQIFKLYAEQLWVIGLVGEIPALLAKKNYFKNVPDKSLYSWARGRRLGLSLPEQYWIDPRLKK